MAARAARYAQAMAVHGGLLARESGQVAAPGMLVALRQVQLYCGRVDTLADDLITQAECLQAGRSSWQYSFRVEHRGVLLASGRAAVMLRPLADPATHSLKAIL